MTAAGRPEGEDRGARHEAAPSRASRRASLGAWLATAFSALSILLTVVLALVIERKAGADVAASIGSNMKVLAQQMTNRLDRGMFERYREVQLMAARLERLPAALPVQLELDAARNSYRYYLWLGVAGPDGTVLAASNGALVGDNVRQQAWFRDALQGVHLGHVQEPSELPMAPAGSPCRRSRTQIGRAHV